ncbi:MAG: cytochrome C oxidase subunit IV family protein [Deltaproteobacteria bacterium]|nr:cytochrome C oxidase subunit IV family protein [Deltaproteobacteria bacterium]
MEHGNTEEMLKHIKIYIFIFLSLAVLTLVTVWASHLQVSHTMHIIIALSIATFKAALVALFFMHLIAEKKAIYGILVFTAVFFLVLIFLTYFTNMNMLRSPLGY